ncbi:MAG: CaiB/BaiF CoA transferase family protein [Reyranellaceae bacterium]
MGPLEGVRVLEIEAIGPVPWCGMMLADMGADVLRVDRPKDPTGLPPPPDRFQFAKRGRRAVVADLKRPAAVQGVLKLAARADILIEGMRPGVMERIGLGPAPCLAVNPRLVFGRMTGWGQDGPLAQKAGHDINYIALAGALHAIGPEGEAPVPPLNLLGDYAGGGMLLALGVCAALVNARATGQGQVVDAAMIDGVASLMAPLFGQFAAGQWKDDRCSNTLDGAAPWYGVYQTADGKFLAVGAVESQFYAQLVAGLGLEIDRLPPRDRRDRWAATRQVFAERIRTRTRDEWVKVFADVDACVSPVLSLQEAQQEAHQRARGTHREWHGMLQPSPAPRFSRTPSQVSAPPCPRGAGGRAALAEWGLEAAEIGQSGFDFDERA